MRPNRLYQNHKQNKAMFAIKSPGSTCKYNQQDKSNSQTLFLLSKICKFQILKIMSKSFIITTKSNTCNFNIYLLKKVSPVISNFLKDNPSINFYHIDIDDKQNVLLKFEQLFQGDIVAFEDDEIPIFRQIAKFLQITDIPSFLQQQNLTQYDECHPKYNLKVNLQESAIKPSVQIQIEIFNNFLIKTAELRNFTIKTNKNKYKCNHFGVYSSNVIYQSLLKDPTIDEFIYDFDDEFDEFQTICNLFNFNEVELKSDNMEIIKEIADDLQIECIMNQVDDFISKYEKFTKKVDENQTIIESIDKLFDLLINIKYHGVEKVAFSIIQSKYSQDKESVQELAAFILQVVKTNVLNHLEISELLIHLNDEPNELRNLIPFIVEILMNFYMPTESNFKNYFNNYESRFIFSFIRILYKKGFIKKEEIINKLQHYDYKNKNFNAFFLPEIIEFNPSCIELIKKNSTNYICNNNDDYFVNFILNYWPDKIDYYREMLDKMEPDDSLTKSLQNDDIDTFQSIIIQNNIKIESKIVPYNIFDDLDENPTILNYSALYGSVKCFKYILLNGGVIDKTTLYFSVYGNNSEIIKIVDQKLTEEENKNFKQNQKLLLDMKKFTANNNNIINNNPLDNRIVKKSDQKNVYVLDYSNDENIIASTIIMHRNELFDWLFEKLFLSKNKTGNDCDYLATISASNGDAHSLVELVDKGYKNELEIISRSAKNGFCQLLELILNLSGKKLVHLIRMSSKPFDFEKLIEFQNLSIFKLLIQIMNQTDLENVIVRAIQKKYTNIINYYFDNYDKIGFPVSDSFLISALQASIEWKTDECYNILIEKVKQINPDLLNVKLFMKLLIKSCSSSNFKTAEILTYIILKQDPTLDFTESFIEACKSKCIDICHFFINMNVFLEYEVLSKKTNEIALVDDLVFSSILKKSNPRIRFRFHRCLSSAISKKNKKLIEYLFKEKAPNDNELFEAVETKDISIVDLVLKYNSKPLFINRKTPQGTALITSYVIKSIDIFKHLLSIPGIDATLTNEKSQNCLSLAIQNHDLQTVDLILDHFGDNIQSQMWVIYKSFNELSTEISNSINSNDNLWQIVSRLFKVKSIDPNIYINDQFTFFYKACTLDKIEVVKDFLTNERIDVNKYEIKSFNTPLIYALNNHYITLARILINHQKTDLNLRNAKGETALKVAIENKIYEIIELIINNDRFDPIENQIDYLFYLAEYNSAKILITSKFLDVNHQFDFLSENNNDFERTALINSAENFDYKKVDLIINHPLFDKYKSDVITSIFIAVKNDDLIIFNKLIKFIDDDDINQENSFGENLLSISVQNLNDQMIDFIFNNKKFDSTNSKIFYSFVELLNYYLFIDDFNKSKTSTSKNKNVVEIMRKIYNYDKNHSQLIDLNKLLPNGKSFFTMIENDFPQIGQISNFLIENGADPNAPDKEGIYPLEHAIKINSINFIISLINSNKIDLSQLPNGNSYLHLATSFSNPMIFKYFLNSNMFDINCTNDEGDTPLIVACKLRRNLIINLLFEKKNLDYLHCNKKGKDALAIIKSMSPEELNKARQNRYIYFKTLVSICRFDEDEFNNALNLNYNQSSDEDISIELTDD